MPSLVTKSLRYGSKADDITWTTREQEMIDKYLTGHPWARDDPAIQFLLEAPKMAFHPGDLDEEAEMQTKHGGASYQFIRYRKGRYQVARICERTSSFLCDEVEGSRTLTFAMAYVGMHIGMQEPGTRLQDGTAVDESLIRFLLLVTLVLKHGRDLPFPGFDIVSTRQILCQRDDSDALANRAVCEGIKPIIKYNITFNPPSSIFPSSSRTAPR